MREIVAVLLSVVSLPALAATVTANWVNPTQYTDGSALAVTAITQTRIEYGTCVSGAFGVKAGEFVSAGNDTSQVSPNLAPGTYCLRAYTTASGVESAASNIATVSVAQPAPRPPTLGQIISAWLRSVFGRFA
jgi:hypothetical protein